MKLAWSRRAWDDYLYWQKTEKKKVKRVNALIKECLRNPFEGIGNPEPLKHELQGFWSRRIDKRTSADLQLFRRRTIDRRL